MAIKRDQLNGGFTMIETFVAITILLIAVVGPMSLIAKFYADNTYARNQIAAAFLAQDGLEAANNILRNNKLQFNESKAFCELADLDDKNSWLGELANCEEGCDINALTGEVIRSGAEEKGFRLYKNATGFYSNEESPEATPYYRLIKVKNLTPAETDPLSPKADMRAADISVEVNWRNKAEWVRRPVLLKFRYFAHQCL